VLAGDVIEYLARALAAEPGAGGPVAADIE
jgi:hypothetical protein